MKFLGSLGVVADKSCPRHGLGLGFLRGSCHSLAVVEGAAFDEKSRSAVAAHARSCECTVLQQSRVAQIMLRRRHKAAKEGSSPEALVHVAPRILLDSEDNTTAMLRKRKYYSRKRKETRKEAWSFPT